MAARGALALRIAQVVAIGLVSGAGFVLPMLVMLRFSPGNGRTLWLLLSLGVAVLLIRRLGRLLHRLLDATDRPLRFPLLVLYAVAVMLGPISLLLLPGMLPGGLPGMLPGSLAGFPPAPGR